MQPTDWIAIAALGAVIVGALLLLQRRPKQGTARSARSIAVDGTNVMFWRDNIALVSTLKSVVRHLERSGFEPVVFLDASSRHHVGDRSLDEGGFARALRLPVRNVMVCPARTEADAFILRFAKDQKVAVVSNDQFRDRPRESRNIRLVKGRMEGQRVILKGL
ncbi:hypothetical protein ABMC89_12180 [Sulfitobacter sp. HNIBRBA3233]|uniref:NYN domain-containing protein n=1 Tax=Sulfitobacter marinivivus TaxID=3158558 RepID=UPI0032DFA21D